MSHNICYLFIKKANAPDDKKEILTFSRGCSSTPNKCFVKTACHVYKDHYDFIFIAEAFGWSYRLNDYYVLGVPNGNMSALCLKFQDRVLLQLIAPSNEFLTSEIAPKCYEIRKSRFVNHGYDLIQSAQSDLRVELRSLLDKICE